MNDTERRDKLDNAIFKGTQAENLLKRLDPKFVELRELYRGNLVHAVRMKSGEDSILMDAYRIAALEDLYESIYQDAVTGRKAQKEATLIEESK